MPSLSSHISVVLDLPPSQWHLSAADPSAATAAVSLASFLTHVLVFLNAHIAAAPENSLAVFGAFPGNSLMLFSSADPLPEQLPIDPNSYPPFKLIDSTITRRIHDQFNALATAPTPHQPSALVSAIIKALCYVNRITAPTASQTAPATAPPAKPSSGPAEHHPSSLPDPRLLILSVSPDLATSYIPIMNSVFSAQKLASPKVTIDVCQIHGPDTVFLQQAAHLTGGSYIHLERRDALLQYLVMAFLPPPAIRKILAVPTQDKVDFRAACFCHKNIIDVGFVCSVCLSIFCQPVPVCSTCRTKFPIKTLQRLNQSRPDPATSRNNSGPLHSGPAGTNGASVARSFSTSATPQSNIVSGELPHSSTIGLRAPNGTTGRSLSMGASGTTPGPNGTTR